MQKLCGYKLGSLYGHRIIAFSVNTMLYTMLYVPSLAGLCKWSGWRVTAVVP